MVYEDYFGQEGALQFLGQVVFSVGAGIVIVLPPTVLQNCVSKVENRVSQVSINLDFLVEFFKLLFIQLFDLILLLVSLGLNLSFSVNPEHSLGCVKEGNEIISSIGIWEIRKAVHDVLVLFAFGLVFLNNGLGLGSNFHGIHIPFVRLLVCAFFLLDLLSYSFQIENFEAAVLLQCLGKEGLA